MYATLPSLYKNEYDFCYKGITSETEEITKNAYDFEE